MANYDQQIEALEEEIRKTPYNKATQHHIGKIKAKIAKLREAAETAGQGTSGGQGGYGVRRSGDGTAIMIGYPSTGKSTLLNKLTGTESEVGAYAFTTLTVVPGLLQHRGAQIQVLDVPGIVSGAASGRGRGKEVLATMRSADLCLLIMDGNKPEELDSIKKEVYDAGIRLDEKKPDIKIVKKARGGLDVGRTLRTPELDDETVTNILDTFRIFNADIVIRTKVNAEQFIDAVQDNKKYMPSQIVITKADLVSDEQKKKLEKRYPEAIFVSAHTGEGIDDLKDYIFNKLGFIRIWMKEPGKEADMDEPLIMLDGSTIRDVARNIHRDFEAKFKLARVTGPSAKFPNQRQGLDHELQDNDVVELHLR